jgi:alpha-N-acetylglucosamine transferase
MSIKPKITEIIIIVQDDEFEKVVHIDETVLDKYSTDHLFKINVFEFAYEEFTKAKQEFIEYLEEGNQYE